MEGAEEEEKRTGGKEEVDYCCYGGLLEPGGKERKIIGSKMKDEARTPLREGKKSVSYR